MLCYALGVTSWTRARPERRPAFGWLAGAVLAVCGLAVLAAPAGAAKRTQPAAPPPPPVLRFPETVSSTLLRDLLHAGLITMALPDEPEGWRRWGRAAPDDQELAVRAITDALAQARVPIDLAAMILTIARVESGFNPFSEHPVSTACGLFQFIEATWQAYQPTRESCLDPYLNAWAGVRHLTLLEQRRLREARALLAGVPDELQRTEYLYRLLYAYHFHGARSVQAAVGGSLTAQQAADGGVPYLRRYYAILKKATYVPPPAPAVRATRPAPTRRGRRNRKAT